MSAIYSYGYMSTNYSSYSMAKSSSVNVSEQASKSNSVNVTSSSSSNSYGDTVTISQEGLESLKALELSVEDAEPKKLDLFSPKEEKKYWYELLERSNSKINANNKEIDSSSGKYNSAIYNPIKFKQGVDTSTASKIYSDKWKNTVTQIDKRITEILNENDITLNKNETLNFAINQDGKITIGKGINEYKKTILEKIFNDDNDLRANLFHSHYSLPCSEPLQKESDSSSSGYDPSSSLTFENLLRNYGFTINDFELTSDEERLTGALPIKFKNETNNNELLLKMFTDDADTFDYIENQLVYMNETGVTPREYELNFSYKNGVTIEIGQGDQNSLDKRYQFILDDSDIPVFFHGEDTSNVAVTINPFGEIIDAEMIKQNLNPRISEKDRYNVTDKNFDLFTSKLKNKMTGTNNTQENQTWFQQYVFEYQRLAKYETGEDTENMNLKINRTFLNETIANGRKSRV